MRFAVQRTSLWTSGKPCDEAVFEGYVYVDERTVSDPTMIPAYRGKDPSWWYGEGRNHRIELGHIKRDFDRKAWFVHFDSADDILRFIDKYGECVIGPWNNNPEIMRIEIYDTYRE